MKSCCILVFAIIFYLQCCAVESLIRCRPCSEITCEPAECTDGQVLKPKAYCNCCDVCFTIVGEGRRCANFGIGGPLYPYECAGDLQCKRSGDTKTCQK